ncbi:MAG: type II secretion system protein [Patescibacteria group bacterium]
MRYSLRGFSLVEITIALAIIGTMIMVTSTLLQRVTVNTREVGDLGVATKIAQGELELLRGGGYTALPASGPFSHSLLNTLPSGAGTVTVTVIDAQTKQVVVTVSWQGSSGTTRTATLTSLIAQNSTLK